MTNLGRSPFDNAAGLSADLESEGPGAVNAHITGDLTVDGTINSAGESLPNNTYLTARNAAGTADLSLLKADASNNTVFNTPTAKQYTFNVNAVANALLNVAEFGPVAALGLTLGTAALPWGQIHVGVGSTLAIATGSNAKAGTFVANGATPVSVATTAFVAGSVVAISLKTIGGTVGPIPHLATATPATGFTVVGTASDTSTYNWAIIDTE